MPAASSRHSQVVHYSVDLSKVLYSQKRFGTQKVYLLDRPDVKEMGRADVGDKEVVLSGSQRLEQVAHTYYADSTLHWVLAMRNNEGDITAFEAGGTVVVPSKTRVFGGLLKR